MLRKSPKLSAKGSLDFWILSEITIPTIHSFPLKNYTTKLAYVRGSIRFHDNPLPRILQNLHICVCIHILNPKPYHILHTIGIFDTRGQGALIFRGREMVCRQAVPGCLEVHSI